MSRAADDITYILAGMDSLTTEELDYKLIARNKRIGVELDTIKEILLTY